MSYDDYIDHLKDDADRQVEEAEENDSLRARIATLEAELAAAREDNEELDGTDAAKPAWWRGHHHGAESVIRALTELLDGKEPAGTCAEPYETLRRRVWELREDAARYQYIRHWAMIQQSTGTTRHNRISWPTIYATDPIDGGNYRDRFDAAIDAARKAKP